MEGLCPKVILLEESEKAQQVYVQKANDQCSNWVNFEEVDNMSLRNERPCNNASKRQIPSSITTKGLIPTNRRFSSSNWTYSLRNFIDPKFEHFLDSSCYIQQYRHAKRTRIEEKLAGLMQSREKRLTHERGNSHAEKNAQSIAMMSAEQDTNSCSKKEPTCGLNEDRCRKQSVPVKPSLPQSGYFAGRKWVYPRDYSQGSNKNIGVKCGDTRMSQSKTANKQVNSISRNMFLRGTGKPLNISSNKNWIPRYRTVCKSAPASRQKQPEYSKPDTTQVQTIKTPARSDSLTHANLSALLERHSSDTTTQLRSSFQTSPVQQSYAQVKTKKNSVESNSDANRLEYEKIFRNVFDFYEQNSAEKRSHLYINIGTY
ncbi:uncharacterized protein LOC114518967 [Dendronephthya gigantea]|uniref:uncharacterized protein LOC114518967 n=1 Tax=Dendronephthya gigantea TaxID=151771 RepID=UPI00106ACE36|nr:uncharacterized protein LOC114518967 [Dendronephthya gigantea]